MPQEIVDINALAHLLSGTHNDEETCPVRFEFYKSLELILYSGFYIKTVTSCLYESTSRSDVVSIIKSILLKELSDSIRIEAIFRVIFNNTTFFDEKTDLNRIIDSPESKRLVGSNETLYLRLANFLNLHILEDDYYIDETGRLVITAPNNKRNPINKVLIMSELDIIIESPNNKKDGKIATYLKKQIEEGKLDSYIIDNLKSIGISL